MILESSEQSLRETIGADINNAQYCATNVDLKEVNLGFLSRFPQKYIILYQEFQDLDCFRYTTYCRSTFFWLEIFYEQGTA